MTTCAAAPSAPQPACRQGSRDNHPPETMPEIVPSDIRRCRLAASSSPCSSPRSAAPRLRGGLRSGDGCLPCRGGDASADGCRPLRGGLASSGLSWRRLLGGEASGLHHKAKAVVDKAKAVVGNAPRGQSPLSGGDACRPLEIHAHGRPGCSSAAKLHPWCCCLI
jgi:hypothetical protein